MTREQAKKQIAEKMRELTQIVKEFDKDTEYFSIAYFKEGHEYHFFNATSPTSPLVIQRSCSFASSLEFNFDEREDDFE